METVETFTLPEFPNYRVRLEYDMDAPAPYDDGAAPILQLTAGGYNGYVADAFNGQAAQYVDAANRLLYLGVDVFERYLKAFHGTIKLQSYGSNRATDYEYLAFDTAEWRDSMGITDTERLSKEDYLSEVRAWCEGDVYGYIVERSDTYMVTKSLSGEIVQEYEETEWEEVDSCWGFYASEYAEQAALEALERMWGAK